MLEMHVSVHSVLHESLQVMSGYRSMPSHTAPEQRKHDCSGTSYLEVFAWQEHHIKCGLAQYWKGDPPFLHAHMCITKNRGALHRGIWAQCTENAVTRCSHQMRLPAAPTPLA
jgi:hypothetical protein